MFSTPTRFNIGIRAGRIASWQIVVSRNAINQTSLVIAIVPLTSANQRQENVPNNVAIASGEGAGLSADSIALSDRYAPSPNHCLLRQRGTLPSDTMQP